MEQHHRWSSLPDDIVFKIISHLDLPIDFVITISTSIFSINELYTSNRTAYNVYEPYCWTVFDNLFTLFTTPLIDTFYLNLRASFYEQPLCCPIIDTWARRLSSCNIRHFTVNNFGGFGLCDLVFPPRIFQMHSLVSLKLYFYFKEISWSDKLSMILLPNLKKLHLVSSNNGLLEELISRCPSLEDLTLTLIRLSRDTQKNSISITSKKLKRLYINQRYRSSSIFKVILDAPILEHYRYVVGSILSMQMLDSILNVKSLALLRQDYCPLKFYNSPKKTVFPNLSHLTLSLPFEVYQKIFDEQFLCCPNLKVLKLHLSGHTNMILNEDVKFVLVEQVKRLEMYMNDYRFSKQTVNLVTWLLRSAKVLEKLVLSSHGPFYYDKSAKSQFYQTLFECVESTSRCQIEFLGDYKLD
ncbi:putative F-box/FBD/LRR-repeat protein At5g25850 [Silene latifolia]|uniref:putative F-box/FBD/LRR-repeat protein At5g25850 n=1 Tax=Silene latifolia TaxID=37657 RepID=UPI003D76B0D9